ncbi:MAG: DNA polymerase III subunit beta [Christensenellaceae bacterium]|jgi:DNA polymerase-3 subunit beta|nr:DNA polymerase III subunit beta [Christensenellaceae bacterium]
MKIICDGACLADAVNTVIRATNGKINPSLGGIKIVAAGDTLTLFATDIEMYITKVIKADVREEGTSIVPGKIFADYVRLLDKSAQVELASDATSIMITHGENVCTFTLMSESEYPDILKLGSKPHFAIKSQDLNDIITKTTICASRDDSRPILKGVLFELEGKNLTCVSLDGYRLAKVNKTVTNVGTDIKFVVPARSLDEVKKMLTGDTGDVNIVIENKFFGIALNGTTFATRLMDGEFINYKQVIPQSFESTAVLDKEEFTESVVRAGIVGSNANTKIISLKFEGKSVAISGISQTGNTNQRANAKITGKDLVIAFNAEYLTTALGGINEQFVLLSYNSALAPCTLTSTKDGGDYLFLILPVRAN